MTPSFLLWNPVLLADRREFHFDVSQYRDQEMATGDKRLISACLSAFQVEAQPTSWKVEPFCSPYFTNNLGAADWRDRILLAWRVKVRLEQDCEGVAFQLNPLSVSETDSTWSHSAAAWKWTRQRCVVIANFSEEAEKSALQRDARFKRVAAIEHVKVHQQVRQERIDLGFLEFPAEEALVMETMQACRTLSGEVTWQSSMFLETPISSY